MKKRLIGSWFALLALAALLCQPALAEKTLASAKTPLSSASSAGIHNIELACSSLDGSVVDGGGGYFSFNDAVGPRTSSYGYKNATNGRGVKVCGGGVAQAASTLYLALKKLDGIEYDEKKTYGSKYVESYVESARDAILVDYKAGTDFSFYNNGARPLRVDMWLSDDYVHCQLVDPNEAASAKSYGEGYASIPLSGAAALENNVTLAADSIYDTVLEYGDLFSFNDVVGPRTARYGYETAVNGRGVKVCGGGVAQVASALYMAVKDMDGIEIVEKTTYGRNYNQRYVDDVTDAIAVDYNGGVDFSFRYVGRDALSLYTYVDQDTLYCEVVEG